MFEDIQYKEIFQFFQEISQIPHGSGNEEELSNYVKAFAEGLSLEVYQDAAYNHHCQRLLHFRTHSCGESGRKQSGRTH